MQYNQILDINALHAIDPNLLLSIIYYLDELKLMLGVCYVEIPEKFLSEDVRVEERKL